MLENAVAVFVREFGATHSLQQWSSSCARRFFKHFNFKFWQMIQYTEEWWIPVSCKIWHVVTGWPSVTLWSHFWLKINSLNESGNVVISARTARSSASLTSSCTASVSQFLTTYSDQKRSNPKFDKKLFTFIAPQFLNLYTFSIKSRSITLYTLFTL